MTGVSIRSATRADTADLQRVFAAAYAPYRTRIKDLPDVSGGLDQDIINHHVWVAEIGSQVVGGIVLVRDKARFHLSNIAVSPDHHGGGVGRALISAAETYAASQGGQEIALATHVDMPENVVLYARLGWWETGREGNKVYMVKTLDE